MVGANGQVAAAALWFATRKESRRTGEVSVDVIRFIFWEAIKILGLVFLALFSAQAIANLQPRRVWVAPALYALLLGLVTAGAWTAGHDIAAEVYIWTAYSNLGRGELVKAYGNALRAVMLRPGNLHCWGILMQSKMRLHQFQSALDDEPTFRVLSGDSLDEADEYNFALCSFLLGQYDQVFQTTAHLIRQSPMYAAPYILQGLADIVQKKYSDAEKSYLAVLQLFPNHQAAVEGLARAYYLDGQRQRALAVIDETAKFPFPAPVRQRFEALRGLYDQ
jgi:tetratricopeptide (TPR) repeat protein